MTEATSNRVPDQATFQPRRGMRFGIAAGCVLVLVVAVCSVSYWAAAHSRYKVVGKTDPVTGYHIEYTVSSRYSMAPRDHSILDRMPTVLEDCPYLLRPPSAVNKWLRKHLSWLNDTKQVPGVTFGAAFSQSTWLGPASAETHVDSQGFVTIGDGSTPPPSAINERTLISGCPTTFTADDGSYRAGGGPTHKFRAYNIVVRPRNQPITFVFMAFSNLTHEPNDLEREMIAIRDSIRVVRGIIEGGVQSMVQGLRYGRSE